MTIKIGFKEKGCEVLNHFQYEFPLIKEEIYVESENLLKQYQCPKTEITDSKILLSKIMDFIQPDFIQLHGQETPERCKEIRNKYDISIIKGIGIKNKQQLAISKAKFELISDILLLDAPSSDLPGGNGNSFNWNILRDYNFRKKWMLAGGINLSNVKDAIETANPPVIDVSSGVEVKKGIKCPELIKEFVTKCRNI